MQSVTPGLAGRETVWIDVVVSSAWGGAGAAFDNQTDSTNVRLVNIGVVAFEYQIDDGPWKRLELSNSIGLDASLASTTIRLRKSQAPANGMARFEIERLTGDFVTDHDHPLPIGGLSPVPVPLTDGASIDTDASNACNFTLELTGDGHMLENPSGLRPGQTYTWRIYNPNGYAMDFGSMFKWDEGTAPTLSSGRDLVCSIYYQDINELHSAIGKDKR